jgi:EAL domain-containing protein (putative c-di-GMP-specific phosphodiesterase class I)
VSHTIALAKELKIMVLAEGVETIEQLRILRENGCDMIQGYYFSKPLHADVFTKLLQNEQELAVKYED